ncbi:flippase [Paludibacter sp. 221]|uniref:flippase n=1 Tax=Paludibacter sp. 221 TaxID=2302939 RepID=UPI0013D1321C|nr:flippase [Paludibacter sp. 221]NDV47421.1 flippase [Paludibacter sp. 221]
MSSNTREIKDVIYLVALQGINYVMPLVVFPYLMVTLGAEKFGYIGFSVSITQYLMLIVDFGFNFSGTKQIAIHKNNPEKLQEIFWSILIAKIGLLIISFIFLLIVAFAIPQFKIYQSTLLIFFLMVVANTFSFVWFFQGIGKIRIISIVNIISKILILPLTFLFVNKPDDYHAAALIQSSVYILGSAITIFILIYNKYIYSCKRPKRKSVLHEIKSAYPIFLSSVASSVYVALFAIILGYFSTPEEVGKYTAAEKIVRSCCYLVFIPISQAFFPKISIMSKEAPDNARRLIKKIAYIVAGIMFVVAVILFFFSDKLMIFLGKDYIGIDLIFKIMAIIPMFVALGGIFGQLGLLALGNEKDKKNYQRTYYIAAILSVVMIFVFIPKLYSTGASIALLITEVIVFIGIFVSYVKRKP